MQVREKLVSIHCVFPIICGSGRSTSRLAKAAGAEPRGQMRDEKLHAVVARSIFLSQKCKKLTGSDHFLTFRVQMSKKSMLLWRDAFPSQKCKKLMGSDHFLTFSCRFPWQAHTIVHLVKSEQNVGFVAISTTTPARIHHSTQHYTTLR